MPIVADSRPFNSIASARSRFTLRRVHEAATDSVGTPGTGRHLATVAVLVVSLLLLGIGWSISSPIGSSPDDDFHLGSIWCGPLTVGPTCEPTGSSQAPGQRDVRVPALISTGTINCFAFQPNQTGACVAAVAADRTALSRANDGLYPSGLYDALSLLVSGDVWRSVLLMRMTSWIVACVLLAVSLWAVGPALQRPFAVAVLCTSVPLMLFVFASTNPSGIATAATAAFAFSAFGALRATTTAMFRRNAVIAGLAAVVALSARPDSPIWITVSAGAVIAWSVAGGHMRDRRLVLPAAAIAGAGVVMLFARDSVDVARGGLSMAAQRRAFGDTWFQNVTEIPGLWAGALGTWSLGWLDTPMPAIVWFSTLTVFGGVVLSGLNGADRAKIAAFALVAAAMVIEPLAQLATDGSVVGEGFQPRYLLPMLPVIAAVALLPPATDARTDADIATDTDADTDAAPAHQRPSGRIPMRLVVSALVVANAVALHTNLRRYAWGLDQNRLNLATGVEWSWPGAPTPAATWTLSVAASAVAAAAIVRLLETRAAFQPRMPVQVLA